MNLDPTQIMTFGDVRRNILNDIAAVRRKEMTVAEAGAIGAFYKELHSNLQVEINAAKMAFMTEQSAHAFGKVVSMGRRIINDADDGPEMVS